MSNVPPRPITQRRKQQVVLLCTRCFGVLTHRAVAAAALGIMLALGGGFGLATARWAAPANAQQPRLQRRLPEWKKRARPKAGIVIPYNSFLFTPTYVAKRERFVAEQGVRFYYQVQSGIGALTSLLEEKAELAHLPGVEFLQVRHLGAPVIAVAQTAQAISQSIVVATRLARQASLTRDSPLRSRLALLRGLTVGITRIGATDHLLPAYAAQLAGLDGARSLTYVVPGGAGELLRDLNEGRIDAFAQSPPLPEIALRKGVGTVLVSALGGDFPALRPFAEALLVTTRETLAGQEQKLRAVLKGYVKALRAVRAPEGRQAAIRSLRRAFPKLPEEVVGEAFDAIRPVFDEDGIVSGEALANVRNFILSSKAPGAPGTLDLPDDLRAVYTNALLPSGDAEAAGMAGGESPH